MILADTSTWIGHLRKTDPKFDVLLGRREIACHPYVIGELACGSLGDGANILRRLSRLPKTPVAREVDMLTMLETHRLMGLGMGYVDLHLLASTVLAPGTLLLTRDRRLAAAAARLGVAAPPL